MSLRILHVASGRVWRGGERQVVLLTRHLRALGLEQLAVTRRDSPLAQHLEAAGIEVVPVSWRAGLDPRVVVPLWCAMRDWRPDRVHAHDAHALTLVSLAAKLGHRPPLVATRRVSWPVGRRSGWHQADRVIAVSHAVARGLVAAGIASDRLVVVHSGVDVSAIEDAPRGDARELLGIVPSAPLAVSVAHFAPEKDHATLLAAARAGRELRPDLHWLLVGEGRGQHRVRREARRLGLDDRVHFRGMVDPPTPLVKEAQVFVSTARSEGLGTAILESLVAGVPVVATAADGPREIVTSEVGRLVAIGDGAGVARAAAALLSDRRRWQAMSAAARARGAEFAAEVMGAKTAAVYESLRGDTTLRAP